MDRKYVNTIKITKNTFNLNFCYCYRGPIYRLKKCKKMVKLWLWYVTGIWNWEFQFCPLINHWCSKDRKFKYLCTRCFLFLVISCARPSFPLFQQSFLIFQPSFLIQVQQRWQQFSLACKIPTLSCLFCGVVIALLGPVPPSNLLEL